MTEGIVWAHAAERGEEQQLVHALLESQPRSIDLIARVADAVEEIHIRLIQAVANPKNGLKSAISRGNSQRSNPNASSSSNVRSHSPEVHRQSTSSDYDTRLLSPYTTFSWTVVDSFDPPPMLHTNEFQRYPPPPEEGQ